MSLHAFEASEHSAEIRRIYEESFPPSIGAPWSEIAGHRGDEELLVLETDAGPIGFALVRHLGDTSFTFTRYFAVDARLRGQGVGATLLMALQANLVGSGRTALLLDVETPIDGHAQAQDDLRRIAFYERHGLTMLPVSDYAPPAHGSTGEQIPLLLMGMSLGDGPALENDVLSMAVSAVYRYRYGVDGPT